jgi:predicted Rossmann fold nucleotide-binding protein DprA/Smf involved in DNA uptake
MKSNDMRPNELLLPGSIDKLKAFNDAKINLNRIKSLLNRGGALAFSVEAWTNRGLWILSVDDESYPRRWRDRLGHTAPPLVYGAGNLDLLSKGGLAIVGSRDVDEVGTDITRTVAKIGAINGIQIISGGARGVDSEAMQAGLIEGGCVVGVLADSLSRESVSVKYRDALRNGRLALVSPYDPGVGFDVGNAMGRNRLIYCLSDCSIVISATLNKGGTWAGAIENLKHKWIPLFVRSGENVPEGNLQLIKHGATAIDTISPKDKDIIKTLFGISDDMTNENVSEKKSHSFDIEYSADSDEIGSDTSDRISGDKSFRPALERDLFYTVWPVIEAELRTSRTDEELAYIFNVQIKQMRAWLKRAVESGTARSTKTKPKRYTAIKEASFAKFSQIEPN